MPGMRIGPNSIVGSHVMVDENLEPDTMLFTRLVELKRKNKLTFAKEKKLELMKRLLRDNV
jgi:hypothetical protein